ncbi:sulfotransferase 6B1-like [Sphaerodactylus townsendi]|uniref:sulfotransferase 6B1-like n=1 Tax=Sphaerodactylus townsendi TaxID=933632 RepID=UPI002026A7A5|nr:sulfotransferase 6B1-like [Sphaerodactylus townsendi]XP_048355496.1 sulfotransferase 6B1-like [Sphaerodactylus townsendi]
MSSPDEEDLIHTFNGIAFTTRSSPELLRSLATFEARDDDILLVSYPKSGTHWLAEIITHLYTSKVTITSPIEFGDLSKLEQLEHLSCKRIMPTHLDGHMLPPTFRLKQCKAIYILRNPKDIAVSMYHYYRENPNLPTIDSWPEFLEMFLKGDVVCGSWFDHILSWEKNTADRNTLFLFYEDMKKDLPKVVKKVSTFLGVNASESRIKEICTKSSFSEMKTNTEKENYDPNRTVCALTSNRRLIFRKGAVGDWKNHFTPKQNRMFEEMFAEKMKTSKVAKHIVYEF